VATTTLLRPGETIGGYRVVDVIGIGGMAIVYRAEQISLGRPVALKVLSSRLTSDESFRERFRREGTHAAALEHTNIVPVYDSGEEDGHLYLAMRLVEGTNLAELIQTRGLTADQTVDLLQPIASALDTAHAAGLIHRDVKPQNILITAHGHPYLADFGVAKGSNTHGLTATGGFVGSVNYASPEQIKGLTLTPASDVYALTAVLYQCLTGRVPYPRETDAGVMHAHLHAPPPTLPRVTRADSDFHTVLARGMAKDPGSRYGHAGDLMTAAALAVGRMPNSRRTSIPAFSEDADEQDTIVTGSSDETKMIVAEVAEGLAQLSNPRDHTTVEQRREPTVNLRREEVPVESEQAPRARRPLILGAVGVLAVAGVAVAALTGGSAHGGTSTFSNGTLALSVGKQWRPAALGLGGLPLRAPITLSAAGIAVDAGTISKPSPIAAAAPQSLLAEYGKPNGEAIFTLPVGKAKRYSWSATTAAPLALVIVSTSTGEIAIACRGSSAADVASAIQACGSIAAQAKVLHGEVEYPGPDPAVAQSLSRSLAARVKVALRPPAALSSSHLSARAGALTRIAAVDQSAADSLTSAQTPARYRPAVSLLVRALRQEGLAATRLATAASHGSRAQYASLRDTLARDEGVRDATSALHALGFNLVSVGRLRIAGLPAASAPHVTTQPARTRSQGASSGHATPGVTRKVSPPQRASKEPTEGPRKIVSPPE
jgi:serine/threonine protein kinase